MNLKEPGSNHSGVAIDVSKLQARPLGQLLVMQSVVGSLPDEESIFSFVCKGLTDVPGVARVAHEKRAPVFPGLSVARFPLVSGASNYGELQVSLADPTAFAPYEAYLANFAAMLAVILEERHQRRLNEVHQKALEERTVKLSDAVSELEYFSYTITHDLRAPLRALCGYGEIVLDDPDVPTSDREYLQRMVIAARRMDQLITDTLSYSTLVRQELVLKPVDVALLLRNMIQTYPNLQPPGVEICLESNLLPVLGNEAALTQCFSNLLTNAVKFVQSNRIPKIVIYSEDKGEFVRLWFHDNGIGISPENQRKIFGLFQRLNSKYEGTGIGLALVSKAAERMGGKVGVESEEGTGSRFWLEFKKP